MLTSTSLSERMDTLRNLYAVQGSLEYGEQVTQRSHAIQCAELARAAHAEPEVILGAFYHDIGHLLEHTAQHDMGGYGHEAHDRVGADYLRAMGFPDRVPELVSGHVAAKRFLTGSDLGYMEQLSEASRITLGYQGGPMTTEECDQFSRHPLAEAWLQLRHWDDEAKLIRVDDTVPEWIWALTQEVLEEQK